jgi:outer membrane receptor for ferrienterochelin and colicin
MRYFYVALFIAFVHLADAQTQPGKVFVSGEFHLKPLRSFIHEMEEKGVHFDYVNQLVEGVKLNGDLKNKVSLEQALSTLLAHTSISFVVTKDGSIVLYENTKKSIGQVETRYLLTGSVTNQETGEPVPFASIYIFDLAKGAVTNVHGIFEIPLLSPGVHTLQMSYVNFETQVHTINLHADLHIAVALMESAVQLDELIITPGAFEISTTEATPVTLGKEEILHSPNAGKDIYRTLKALPGIANNDYSAKARIRGGHSEETGVYLDHFLINEPFHLEEVDGSFSIFNTDYIEELNVLMGGFSARYTDRLSGILDVRTADYNAGDQYKLSVDLMNAGVMLQKRINSKTDVFLTGRRGYLDFLLRKMETDDTDKLLPRFSDLWGKVSFEPNNKNRFTYNFLMGYDNFLIRDQDDVSGLLGLQNVRNNINNWVNWKWFPSRKISAITTLGYQRTSKRADFSFQDNLTNNNIDQSFTNTFVFTNTSYWNIAANGTLEAGIDLRLFKSSYRYKEVRADIFNSNPQDIKIDTLNVRTTFDGNLVSGYAQYNWKPLKGLAFQPGVRISSQSFSPAVKWAPRVALSYQATPQINMKLAYGIYYQPDLYYKLRTAQGQSSPYRENAKSVHYTGAVTWSRKKTHVQGNLYYKDNQKLFDDYRYEFFNRLGGVSILDVPFGTTSGYSKGAEIMVRRNYGKNNLLSVSYAYAVNKIRNAADEVTYRDFDQRHTIIVNNIFRLPKAWNMSFLWTFHTGNPYTHMNLEFIGVEQESGKGLVFYNPEPKNASRLPDFHTLDIRIEKSWFFKRNFLTAYINVINFYNRENIRSYVRFPYRTDNGTLQADYDEQIGIPFFISPGISFTIR